VRVAEANAGKPPTGGGANTNANGAGVDAEALLMAMTKEARAFEAELASKLGPEEAKRLAWAPEMCSDRTTVRAKDDDPEGDMPQGRAGRGGQP
jgi:hypothetical protein